MDYNESGTSRGEGRRNADFMMESPRSLDQIIYRTHSASLLRVVRNTTAVSRWAGRSGVRLGSHATRCPKQTRDSPASSFGNVDVLSQKNPGVYLHQFCEISQSFHCIFTLHHCVPYSSNVVTLVTSLYTLIRPRSLLENDGNSQWRPQRPWLLPVRCFSSWQIPHSSHRSF